MENSLTLYLVIFLTITALGTGRAFLAKRGIGDATFQFFGRLEIAFVTLLLASLIFFGCLQIILRNFLHQGLLWADPLMRHTVLWLGCMGGALAASRMRHINIDIFSRLLPERVKPLSDKIIHLATAIASSFLGVAAVRLVVDEKAFGDTSFLNIDTWMLQLVLPFTFLIIAYRSVFLCLFPQKTTRPGDMFEEIGSEEDGEDA